MFGKRQLNDLCRNADHHEIWRHITEDKWPRSDYGVLTDIHPAHQRCPGTNPNIRFYLNLYLLPEATITNELPRRIKAVIPVRCMNIRSKHHDGGNGYLTARICPGTDEYSEPIRTFG